MRHAVIFQTETSDFHEWSVQPLFEVLKKVRRPRSTPHRKRKSKLSAAQPIQDGCHWSAKRVSKPTGVLVSDFLHPLELHWWERLVRRCPAIPARSEMGWGFQQTKLGCGDYVKVCTSHVRKSNFLFVFLLYFRKLAKMASPPDQQTCI